MPLQRLKTLLLLPMALLASASAMASHVVAGDIRYEQVGKDSFKIIVSIVRDCGGNQLSSNSIALGSACASITTSHATTISGGHDITPLCASKCSRCVGTVSQGCASYGMQHYTLERIIDVSSINCCEVVVSWTECCRSNRISTGPSGNMYLEARFNKCQKDPVTAPKLNAPPLNLFCRNQCIIYNPDASDEAYNSDGDRDSFVFHIAPPLERADKAVTYSSPYSYIEPLEYNGFGTPKWDGNKCQGFHLDTFTGEMRFMPTKDETTVVGMIVKEYRKDSAGNWVQIGQFRRDHQLMVTTCAKNAVPGLSLGQNATSMAFCVGKQSCYTVHSFDSDIGDSVKVKYHGNIPGLSVTVETNVAWPKARVCWTPGPEMANQQHQLVLHAEDDACPINARSSKAFALIVADTPQVDIKVKHLGCGEVEFTAIPTSKTYIGKYDWIGEGGLEATGSVVKHKFPKGGSYPYMLMMSNTNNCYSYYFDTIAVPDYIYAELPADTTICKGTPYTIKFTHTPTTGSYEYQWSTRHNEVTNFRTSETITVTSDTTVWAKVTENGGKGCSYTDTIHIRMIEKPTVNLGEDRFVCAEGETLSVQKAVSEFRPGQTYTWLNIGHGPPIGHDSQLVVKTTGRYALVVKDLYGCTSSDTVDIVPNAPFDVLTYDTTACYNQTLELPVGSGQAFFRVYNHKTQKADTLQPGQAYVLPNVVEAQINLEITAFQNENGISCAKTSKITVHGSEKPNLMLKPIPRLCISMPSFSLEGHAGYKPGQWFVKGAADAVEGDTLYPQRVGVGDHWLFYATKLDNGCMYADSISLGIDLLPNIVLPRDTVACHDMGPVQLPMPLQGGIWEGPNVFQSGSSGKWYFNAHTMPEGAYTLKFTYTDSSTDGHCSNSANWQVAVLNAVYPKFEKQYHTICRETPGQQLTAVPVGGTFHCQQVPNAVNPLTGQFNPNISGSGTFKVAYRYSRGGYCTRTDTAIVTVPEVPEITLQTGTGDTIFCVLVAPVPLFAQANLPGNGTWSGDSIKNGIFFPSLSGPGVKSLRYTFTAQHGCTYVRTLKVKVTDTPSLFFPVNAFCQAESYKIAFQRLNVGEATFYLPPGSNSSIKVEGDTLHYTPAHYGYEPISFQALLKPEEGSRCQQQLISYQMEVYPIPRASFETGLSQGCDPLAIGFVNTSTVPEGKLEKMLWNFGDGRTSTEISPMHTYFSPGQYQVSLIAWSSTGCLDQYQAPQKIDVWQSPKAGFVAQPSETSIATPTITFRNTSELEEQPAYYLWFFGDKTTPDTTRTHRQAISHTFADTGWYPVKMVAVSGNGCIDSAVRQKAVRIAPEAILFVPSAFSPNNLYNDRTKVNEVFKPSVEFLATYKLSVYTRWGQQVFYTEDINQGWDGTFNGQPAPEGNYLYTIHYTTEDRQYKVFSGTVFLMR